MTARKAPATAKKPQDRQTAKADVVAIKSSFEWRGEDYTIDTDLMDDLEFFEALETGQYATATRMMLGDEQYTKLKAQIKAAEGRVSMSSAQEFLEAYMKEAKRGK